jgi:replication factor C small subunit
MNIWTFEYEPKSIDEMVLDSSLREKLEDILSGVPNLLLVGPPGVGKGTFVHILLKKTGYDYIWINASDETGIDVMRDKVRSFSTALGTSDLKIVVLNECLEENEEIQLSNGEYIALKDININDKISVKSLNLENGNIEDDMAQIINDKIDDIYEVELEDGRKIKATKDHPFIVSKNGKLLSEELENLTVGDKIVTL